MPSDRDMSSGRTSEARSPRAPLARWNPNRDCWETDRVDLLSGLSDVWSETWPTSGTWADGSVYASPTWADAMDASASSSLPNVRNNENRQSAGFGMNLGEALGIVSR